MNNIEELIRQTLMLSPDAQINEETCPKDIPEWDSLGHITILSGLDDFTSGKSADLVDLTQATSVQELIDVLKENNFIDK